MPAVTATKVLAYLAGGLLTVGGTGAVAAGALPAGAQNAAHDVFATVRVSVPGGSSGTSTSDATTPTNVPTDPTTSTSVPNGPDPSGPALFGLCHAYQAGQGVAHDGKKADAPPFVALANAAATAGETIDAYCASAAPGSQGTTPTTTGAAGSDQSGPSSSTSTGSGHSGGTGPDGPPPGHPGASNPGSGPGRPGSPGQSGAHRP